MDVEHAEIVEKQLDAMIERRSKKGEVDRESGWAGPQWLRALRAQMQPKGKARGSVYARLERLEARTPAPDSPPEHRQRVTEFLDRLVAHRQAGCPDTEEGRELRAISEAFMKLRGGRGKL